MILSIFRQSLGKLKITVHPLRRALFGRDGALGEGGGHLNLLVSSWHEQTRASDFLRDIWIEATAEAAQQSLASALILLLVAEKQAHFRVTEVGVVVGRIGLELALPFEQGFLASSLARHISSQKICDVVVGRIDFVEAAKMLHRLFQPPRQLERVGQVVVRPAIVWINRQRLVIATEGF